MAPPEFGWGGFEQRLQQLFFMKTNTVMRGKETRKTEACF
jgi:hypothetical protein